MAEYVNVAVDAMGGDNAPAEIVKGAVEAWQSVGRRIPPLSKPCIW